MYLTPKAPTTKYRLFLAIASLHLTSISSLPPSPSYQCPPLTPATLLVHQHRLHRREVKTQRTKARVHLLFEEASIERIGFQPFLFLSFAKIEARKGGPCTWTSWWHVPRLGKVWSKSSPRQVRARRLHSSIREVMQCQHANFIANISSNPVKGRFDQIKVRELISRYRAHLDSDFRSVFTYMLMVLRSTKCLSI